MSIPRHFVEEISSIEPDAQSGIVKLTFSVKDKGKPVPEVQLVIPVDALNKAFQTVGEQMQKTFGGGGGGGGRPPHGQRGQRPPPGQKGGRRLPKDLTE